MNKIGDIIVENLPELKLLKQIGKLADEQKIDVYLVGGAVRDFILGKSNFDMDIVVVSDGIKFAKELQHELKSDSFVAWEQFGTAELGFPKLKLEVATARSEEYVKHSRKPSVKASDINSDLKRRDFTINAMAISLNSKSFGNLLDPFNGKGDIEKKILKTPLNPNETLNEDPLRMLRAIRFSAQLNFDVDNEVMRAIRKEKDRLSIVSQERITAELFKILATEKPSIGIVGLLGSELLETVLPEMIPMIGVEQVGQYHHKDVFWHTLEVVDNLSEYSDNIDLRFSALVHDIAKPDTKKFVKGKGWTFHSHEVLGSKMVEELGRRLKLSRKTIKFAKKMTFLHLRPIALVSKKVTDSAVRRFIVRAGEDVESLMMLCRADITTKNPAKAKAYMKNFQIVEEKMYEVLKNDELKAFQSPIRGEEIMRLCDIKPGKAIGIIKHNIEQAILDGEIPNEYDASLEYFLNHKDKWLSEIKD